ncbi:hypothetical protein DPMN_166045, partial [Dreissena polymorpha]
VWFVLPAEKSPDCGENSSTRSFQYLKGSPDDSPEGLRLSASKKSAGKTLATSGHFNARRARSDRFLGSQLSEYSLKSSAKSKAPDLSQHSLQSSGNPKAPDLSQHSLKSSGNPKAPDLSQHSLTLSHKDKLKVSELSQYSFKLSLGKPNRYELSQHSLRESAVHEQPPDLSQYSLKVSNCRSTDRLQTSDLSQHSMASMEASDTRSTNDTQEISTSYHESATSDGQYDDNNSTSSLHDSHNEEAVSTAIMEVSGELLLGKFSSYKSHSGGSESSDISEDDAHRAWSGGAIAKYPESSTGLSDNDWNPYATESDTNQTPRSPRSNNSDENRVGYVSKASINIGASGIKPSTATVSMTTGEVDMKKTEPKNERSDRNGKNGENLDILRYVVDDTKKSKDLAKMFSKEERVSPEARSDSTEKTLSARQSTETDSFKSEGSGILSSRPSYELDHGERRESADSGGRSGRQSVDSGQSGRSSRSDRDVEGRQSADSQHSLQSGQSNGSEHSQRSQKRTGRSDGSDRSDRLDKLGDTAGKNVKELIEFESAQRPKASGEGNQQEHDELPGSTFKSLKESSNDSISRTRLTARLEPYSGPVRSSKSPERSSRGEEKYISISEREKLLTDSPEYSQLLPKHFSKDGKEKSVIDVQEEKEKPKFSSVNMPTSIETRSPSSVSMRRVSNLFEETKRQAREAVSLPRPDPSGSEERFPLRERLTVSKHDDSFMHAETVGAYDVNLQRTRQSRESDIGRSLNSEEVARVLGKYAEDDATEPQRKPAKAPLKSTEDDDAVLVSAFDRPGIPDVGAHGDDYRQENKWQDKSDDSDDEVSRRVRAILSQTDHLGVGKAPTYGTRSEYVPRTIDYSRLHRDLEEIQDSLHNVPQARAEDSLNLHLRSGREGGADGGDMASSRESYGRSLEETGTTYGGRDSGVSEYGRRLVWDHGADLQYEEGYGGQFIGTVTSTETLSTRLRSTGDSDTPVTVRPDSAATDDFESDFEATRTLTGSSDMTRAERLVQQVMSRRAEGDLKESVEDIIARYRNERRVLFDRLQEPEKKEASTRPLVEPSMYAKGKASQQLTDPDIALPAVSAAGDATPKERKQPGLAERVYKILTHENEDSDTSQEKGMAKKVYKILASDRPQEQVNGILSETLAEEHKMLKKIVSRPKEDSSMDDSGLNQTGESFTPNDNDICRQLEYSQFSSPGKGKKSLASLKEVTSAPYSALSNAKSLLSTQLKKMTERNFDKSIELRTPYRQVIDCYPVYGMEREMELKSDPREATGSRRNEELEEVREAWMPSRRSAGARSGAAGMDPALNSERFFLTERDRKPMVDPLEPERRGRTYSDPFDIIPGRRSASLEKEGHVRSKSEESPSDVSQFSYVEPEFSPTDRRAASSRHTGLEFGTPQQHRPQEWSVDYYTSPSNSSTPRRASDSSDGNKWRNHGFQLYKPQIEPKHDPQKSQRSQNKTSALKHSEEIDRFEHNASPIKMAKHSEHQSRSREKKVKSGKVTFQPGSRVSRSLPKYYPDIGFVDQIPISSDDVYDLLCRSQAQEKKLAELQKKLLGEGHLGISTVSSSSSDLSFSKFSGSHGNARNSFGGKSPLGSSLSRSRTLGAGSPSPTESDTSGSRKGTRLRPYRPAGSRDMYYTESGDETNESATTIESTHPGSDDAAPPYIPSQYLGSRLDAPIRHPTGIYGNKDKDTLSTIDEQSVKDEKDKALTSSTGSGKSGKPAADLVGRRSEGDLGSSKNSEDRRSGVTTDTGYHSTTTRSRSPFSLREVTRSEKGDSGSKEATASRPSGIERPGFKTREEFQRDFERREQELKAVLARSSQRQEPVLPANRDSLGQSTRSDPGGSLEEVGPRWEYRESDPREFQNLEPEPAYPQDRLRYSRSRSDSDLVALTPTDSQKYSSPMQPGTRFLELSTQPSPIFSHQDSLTLGAPRGPPGELPRVPPSRELPRQQIPAELPRVPDRPEQRSRSPPSEYPVRPLEPGEGSRSQGQVGSADVMGPVDLGADPRKMGSTRRNVGDLQKSGRSKSPLPVRQQEMEVELERLNKQLTDQVNALQGKKDEDKQFEDNFPPSKKAQVLREVLEQEYMESLPPNINDMWTRFKERNEQSVSESSLNSTRLDALSGLITNPTHRAVTSFIKEKSEGEEKKRQEDREKAEQAKVEQSKERAMERKEALERAARERDQRRQELRAKNGLSEEESNGSYTEILMEEERRRERKKREARREEKREKRNRSPGKRSPTDEKEDGKVKGGSSGRGKDQETLTDIRARKHAPKNSDSMDTLFSIPEDASFEQSPSKAESEMKARQKRHRHVIDPLMMKLRDKIKVQRVKIDKERRKELQRVEKLKKLEMLLTAKRKGRLSDKAIDVELENVSTTSCVTQSESSHLSDSTLTVLSSGMSAHESDASSQASTTLKDSTIDGKIKLQVKKYDDGLYKSPTKKAFESDSTESSDFNNIIVERIPDKRSSKKSKDKKSKEKKYKYDEYGNNNRKEKKDKKSQGVFGVELSENDILNQILKYKSYMTPQRDRLTRDASTMYPSPITVSPPSQRRLREVLMKSEAIQTSPSVRSTSPTHAYDEVPVAPVPYMSQRKSKTSKRRPSPSPTRSTQTSTRKTSTSPVTNRARVSSRSPVSSSLRKNSRSPVSSSLRKSSRSPPGSRPPITRKQAQTPIWKPECEMTSPPVNSMFTPEDEENIDPRKLQKHEATSWFIPMKPGQPWRKPLKERQAFAVRQEAWAPKSVPQSTWKNIVHGDIVKERDELNDTNISRDTKFDLDPEGQPVVNEGSESEDELEIIQPRPLSKLTLQEAFNVRKQATISRLRERQKRLALSSEQRKMEVYLQLERDRLFQEERRRDVNPEAHPYSEHLHKPARRTISKEEMKEMTQKKYKKLPEILEQQKMKKRQEEYSLNRLKARLFNRKIQKKVLVKADKWGR